MRKFQRKVLRYLKPFLPRSLYARLQNRLDLLFLIEAIGSQAEYEKQLEAARNSPPFSVRLKLKVPIHSGSSESSWLGGMPSLPDQIEWPHVDGRPAFFIAQIDCADLPSDLWGSMGPRSGWLVFFLDNYSWKPIILHTKTLGVRCDGPTDQHADWFNDLEKAVHHSPKWPIEFHTHVAGIEEPHKRFTMKHEDQQKKHSYNKQVTDLNDLRFRPFDRETLELLVDCAQEGLQRRLSYRRHPDPIFTNALKTAKEEGDIEKIKSLRVNEEWVNSRYQSLESAASELGRIRQELSYDTQAPQLSVEHINALVHRISKFTIATSKHIQKDSGHILRERVNASIFSCFPGELEMIRSKYKRYLFDILKHRYCTGRGRLPPESKSYVEEQAAFHAVYEIGGMGNVPFGLVRGSDHSPCGQVVLLELATSDLLGWNWGDLHTGCFTISVRDLAANEFRKVKFEISN